MVVSAIDGPRPSRGYVLYALALLASINLLSYINRNVIFALFEPIKHDLHLRDAHLGWLGSAYVLVFSLAALPFGIASDLRSRRAVIAWGVSVWSVFTVLCGLVQSFWPLFVCRAAVGVGGAAFGAASASLVADFFPGKNRAAAMGVLAAGIAVGGVLGIWVGGAIESAYGWRAAFALVGLPGIPAAMLVARLKDPSRQPARVQLRKSLHEVGMGVSTVARHCAPLLLGLLVGSIAAFLLDQRYGASSALDTAAFGAAAGLGVAFNIRRWVRLVRAAPAGWPASGPMSGALDDLMRAGATVLATPTLVYIFIGGALISFGLNGIVGWAPTFMSRELGLRVGTVTALLGKWGLVVGTLGTLTGGLVADGLSRYTRRARVLTVSMGFILGAPLAIWLLTIRDLHQFVPVFCAAFFFLTWYSGPIAAVIFDVVPSKIGATVAGAYLMFIHLAGDTIAFPLVGILSDRFGIHRAVMVLPLAALLGGLVVLGAARTVTRDMARTEALPAA
ncbi:MAG: MFS transporter [Gemmatimonadota bacterium]